MAGMVRPRRPKYLCKGLTQYGSCAGGFVLSSHDLLTCRYARSPGTCVGFRQAISSAIGSAKAVVAAIPTFMPDRIEAMRHRRAGAIRSIDLPLGVRRFGRGPRLICTGRPRAMKLTTDVTTRERQDSKLRS